MQIFAHVLKTFGAGVVRIQLVERDLRSENFKLMIETRNLIAFFSSSSSSTAMETERNEAAPIKCFILLCRCDDEMCLFIRLEKLWSEFE